MTDIRTAPRLTLSNETIDALQKRIHDVILAAPDPEWAHSGTPIWETLLSDAASAAQAASERLREALGHMDYARIQLDRAEAHIASYNNTTEE